MVNKKNKFRKILDLILILLRLKSKEKDIQEDKSDRNPFDIDIFNLDYLIIDFNIVIDFTETLPVKGDRVILIMANYKACVISLKYYEKVGQLLGFIKNHPEIRITSILKIIKPPIMDDSFIH